MKYLIYFYSDEAGEKCLGYKVADTQYGMEYIAEFYSGRSCKRVKVYEMIMRDKYTGVKADYPTIDRLTV
jgi:hypothetical protein